MVKKIKIAVMPGDGIGPEVTNEAVKALQATELNIEFIPCICHSGHNVIKTVARERSVKSCNRILAPRIIRHLPDPGILDHIALCPYP